MSEWSRRTFLASVAASLVHAAEPVIDIHQHTNYAGRSDDELIAHQTKMGVTRTVLLPSGSQYGLDVGAGGNDSVVALAGRHPEKFSYFANEVPDLAGARQVLEKYLKLGAIGIGEQKFPVECDSPAIHMVAEVAEEFGVPILLHFQHAKYNMGIERFHTVLEKHPRVNFIGHAQTWWGNIDRNHQPEVMYPKTKVAPGGITDRLLSDYPNMFGDLSAGSGLNALLRDEDHAQGFLARHQDKLLFGSDCDDRVGEGAACSGSRCLATIRRLAPTAGIATKIVYGNAARLLRLKLPERRKLRRGAAQLHFADDLTFVHRTLHFTLEVIVHQLERELEWAGRLAGYDLKGDLLAVHFAVADGTLVAATGAAHLTGNGTRFLHQFNLHLGRRPGVFDVNGTGPFP